MAKVAQREQVSQFLGSLFELKRCEQMLLYSVQTCLKSSLEAWLKIMLIESSCRFCEAAIQRNQKFSPVSDMSVFKS
jgi:hypothetical protein